MQISVRTSDNVIVQYGASLGELDGCTIIDIDDSFISQLNQDGDKTWDSENQTITVTPNSVVIPTPQLSDPIPTKEEDFQTIANELGIKSAEASDALRRLLGV